jgi:hypothetical protein
MVKVPSPPPNPAWVAIVISCLALISVIIGWFVVNSLTKQRERQRVLDDRRHAAETSKENRKKSFLGFLRKWRAEISPVSRGNPGIGTTPSVSIAEKVYDANVGRFWEMVETVRCDYSDADKFAALTRCLGNLKPEDWKGKKPNDVICGALDALIEFCERNPQNARLL